MSTKTLEIKEVVNKIEELAQESNSMILAIAIKPENNYTATHKAVYLDFSVPFPLIKTYFENKEELDFTIEEVAKFIAMLNANRQLMNELEEQLKNSKQRQEIIYHAIAEYCIRLDVDPNELLELSKQQK